MTIAIGQSQLRSVNHFGHVHRRFGLEAGIQGAVLFAFERDGVGQRRSRFVGAIFHHLFHILSFLAWEHLRHLARDRMYQFRVVDVVFAGGKAGNYPPNGDCDEATYQRIVHVCDGVDVG